MPDAALPNVQEHAKKLQEQLSAGKTVADAAAAARQAEAPQFSQGTQPVDGAAAPTTGADFGESTVALAEPTETTGGTSQQPAPDAAVPAPAQTQTPAQVAGSTAAEVAAQQIVDAFGEFEEFEIEDPDLNLKYPVRVPKQYATSAKRGYPRRADYDRTRQRWGEAAPVLEPLIQDGRLRQILPLIQRALQDPAYGEYVWNGYERAQRGLSLIEQAAAQAAAIAPPAAPQTIPGQEPPLADPFFDEALKPYRTQVETLAQTVQTLQQQREETERRAREEQQRNAQVAQQMQFAHSDLASMYPGEFNTTAGPTDPSWQKACQFARDYGYIDSYGLRAGIIFGAQRWREIEAERLAATASPAAQALQSVDARTMELAQRQAAAVAQTAGGGAPMASAPAAPRPKPTPRNQDGSLKPADQHLREVAAWVAEQRPAS